jgi:hypothetical protein
VSDVTQLQKLLADDSHAVRLLIDVMHWENAAAVLASLEDFKDYLYERHHFEIFVYTGGVVS